MKHHGNVAYYPVSMCNKLYFVNLLIEERMFLFEADDWECRLGENEPQMFNDDADDVYGVNNLNYLQQQLKGYDAESNHGSNQEEEYTDGDNILVSTSETTKKDSISIDSSGFHGDEDGSGDGSTASDTEIKADYIPIPNNADPSGTVSTHLQRLSQIIKGLSSDQYQSFELGPDELNEFLALQKIKAELGNSKEIIISPNSKPIPSNGQVSPTDLHQIIDLQNKIKKLGATRDTYSTLPTPSQHSVSVSGSGYYPSDATTVHISATNSMKNPRFPDVGYATSQIVVNGPEGSVVFSLPTPTSYEPQHEKHKNEPSISEETLKTLLEISKQMQSTQQTHQSQPISTASSPLILPVVQPIYNYPFSLFPNYEEGNKYNGVRPMHKISSISGNLDDDGIVDHRPEDIGLSTVVHNHIPITITRPNNPNVSVNNNRYKATSTSRPSMEDNTFYDSYGTKISSDSTQHKYYSYKPYNDELSQHPTIGFNSEYGYQSHNGLHPSSSPNYIQIPQYNQGVLSPQQPIPTFSSDDTQYTDKYYTPTPHLNTNNVNHYVNVEQKPFPTLSSTYDPMASSSNLKPAYSQAPTTILHSTTYSQYGSSNYDDEYDRNGDENIDQGESNHSDNSEYNYSNSDETSSENVMNSLAKYNVATSSMRTTKNPLFQFKPSSNENHKQIVNLNGNYMSLETYQSSIEPYLQHDPPQIEVLTCATGVRQANSTDCTKYFVCNSKTGKVLSYTCPPYTAFNPETKICNAKTFADCHPLTIRNRVTLNTSQQIKQDAQHSLLEAQRIKAEALKAQHLAQKIRFETQKIIDANGQNFQMRPIVPIGAKSTRMPLPTPPMRLNKNPLPRPHTTQTTTTTTKQGKKKSGKRKIPCRKEGNLPDALSKYNYFMCYKGVDGKMRARKLPCPAKLIFCVSSGLCTSASRCSARS